MSKEKFVRDKPHVNIGLFIALFSILSTISLGIMIYKDAMATFDSDGDSIPDDIESREKVPLFLQIYDETLTISTFDTESSTTSGGHEVGHHLGLSHGSASNLELDSSLYDDTSTGIPILEFNIKYDSLIEFLDTDSNGFFEPSIDVILGQTALINLSRTQIKFGVDGQATYHIGYSTNNGVFQVDNYRSREHVLLSRGIGLITPNELKSILIIKDHVPLTGDAQLALNLSLTSNQDLVFSNQDFIVKTSTDNYEIRYEWPEWDVAGESTNKVNVTLPSTTIPSTKEAIYINFGEIINGSYNPKLSWTFPTTLDFTFLDLPWSYITIGLISLLAIAVTVKIIRKKPGRTTWSPVSTSSDSKHTSTEAEKRIPETLKHRNR